MSVITIRLYFLSGLILAGYHLRFFITFLFGIIREIKLVGRIVKPIIKTYVILLAGFHIIHRHIICIYDCSVGFSLCLHTVSSDKPLSKPGAAKDIITTRHSNQAWLTTASCPLSSTQLKQGAIRTPLPFGTPYRLKHLAINDYAIKFGLHILLLEITPVSLQVAPGISFSIATLSATDKALLRVSQQRASVYLEDARGLAYRVSTCVAYVGFSTNHTLDFRARYMVAIKDMYASPATVTAGFSSSNTSIAGASNNSRQAV